MPNTESARLPIGKLIQNTMAVPEDQNTASPDLLRDRTNAVENTEPKLVPSDEEIPASQITPSGNGNDGASQRALPPATEDVLLHFQREPTNSRTRSGNLVAKRERKGQDEAAHKRHRATLARLRECLKEDDPGDLKSLFLSYIFQRYRSPTLPSLTDLLGLAWQFYPPRGELNVHVCDIYPDRAEWSEIKLGDVEACMDQRISLFVNSLTDFARLAAKA